MLSVDEKSQIQASPGPADEEGPRRHEDADCKRHGTTTLFAALNVLDGTVIGRNMQRHRHQEFIRFCVAEAATCRCPEGRNGQMAFSAPLNVLTISYCRCSMSAGARGRLNGGSDANRYLRFPDLPSPTGCLRRRGGRPGGTGRCMRSKAPSARCSIRRNNVVVQKWDLSCGAAALATVLRFQHDDNVSERKLVEALISRDIYIENPDLVRLREGFSLLDLKRVGGRARLQRLRLRRPDLPGPA